MTSWPVLHEGLRRVLRELIIHGGQSRVDMARKLDVSRANLSRLTRELLDLGLGGFTAWAMAQHIEMPSWTPTFSGWIVVLMLFVLARVFQRGAEMRDDLAMTV